MRHTPYRRNKENTYTMILLKNSVEQTVYEVLDLKSPRFELCVTDVPPARMRKL